MSDSAESYMHGWKAGYHNATNAEQRRIIQIIKLMTDEQLATQLEQAIKRKDDNGLSRQG